jgi:hypothetical protein
MNRRAIAACVLGTLGGLTAGCQQQRLFPDSMSPTQLQQQEMNAGGQRLPYYDLNEGDNEDPCFDNAAYPNMEQPWWNSPGYIGG